MLYVHRYDSVKKRWYVGNSDDLSMKLLSDSKFSDLTKREDVYNTINDITCLPKFWSYVVEKRMIDVPDKDTVIFFKSNKSIAVHHNGYAYDEIDGLNVRGLYAIFLHEETGALGIDTENGVYTFIDGLCVVNSKSHAQTGYNGKKGTKTSFKRRLLL